MKTITEITQVKSKHLECTTNEVFYTEVIPVSEAFFCAVSLKSSKLCHFCKLQLQKFF